MSNNPPHVKRNFRCSICREYSRNPLVNMAKLGSADVQRILCRIRGKQLYYIDFFKKIYIYTLYYRKLTAFMQR